MYLGRFRMFLNTSRNHVSRSIVEAFKSVQENKLKVQCYYSLIASMCRGLRKLFNPCARHLLFVEVQEFQNSDMIFLESVNVSLSLLFSEPQTYKRIVLRVVKQFTSCRSIEQTLFKQIMTGDEVLALVHLFLLKKLLCMCTVGFCYQASS